MRRKPVSKGKSAKSFNRNSHKTHPYNVRIQRGGYRL